MFLFSNFSIKCILKCIHLATEQLTCLVVQWQTSPKFLLHLQWQEGHPACKKTEWWVVGVVICLERGADLHMAQLVPLALTV